MSTWMVQVFGQVTDLAWQGFVEAPSEEEAEVEGMRRWSEAHPGKRDPQRMTSAHECEPEPEDDGEDEPLDWSEQRALFGGA